MRTVVFDRDMIEISIKPTALLDEYRKLLAEDSRELLKGALTNIPCPGCLGKEREQAFNKEGYTYWRCLNCESIYVSPRPGQEDLDRFYRQGRASQYWRERILQETIDVRRRKIIRPRARWVLDALDKYLPFARNGVAVGYHNQLLISELKLLEHELFPLKVISPIADEEFSELKLDGITIHTGPIDEALGEDDTDVFMFFDSIDRMADPDTLFQIAARRLVSKGLVLGNAVLASGFDIQNLWERAPSVYPPERLNLFSVEGLEALFERHDFRTMEFSTPGTFDVEIVRRYVQDHPELEWPRFMRYLVHHRDDNAMHQLQNYLQQHLLSSFGRFAVTSVK